MEKKRWLLRASSRLATQGFLYLFGFVIIIQLVLLFKSEILPIKGRAWWIRSEQAIERSARLSFGDDFSAYINFLRERIPENSLVVIPPLDQSGNLGHTGLMQYFLFPRRITNCPRGKSWDECAKNITGPATYILSIGTFPPGDVIQLGKTLILFDATRGVYIPVP